MIVPATADTLKMVLPAGRFSRIPPYDCSSPLIRERGWYMFVAKLVLLASRKETFFFFECRTFPTRKSCVPWNLEFQGYLTKYCQIYFRAGCSGILGTLSYISLLPCYPDG
ncbi:unnamed protein product [Ectocarpus sp. 12 AP-2014]